MFFIFFKELIENMTTLDLAQGTWNKGKAGEKKQRNWDR